MIGGWIWDTNLKKKMGLESDITFNSYLVPQPITHIIQFIKQDSMTATTLINKPEYKLQISGKPIINE